MKNKENTLDLASALNKLSQDGYLTCDDMYPCDINDIYESTESDVEIDNSLIIILDHNNI